MRLYKHCNLLKYLQTRGCVVAQLVCVFLYFCLRKSMYLLTKIYRRTILHCYIKIVHAKLVLWAKGLHDSMKTR